MGTDDDPAPADQPEPGLAGVCSSFGDPGSAPRIVAHSVAFLLGDLFLTADRRGINMGINIRLSIGPDDRRNFFPVARFLILHFFI